MQQNNFSNLQGGPGNRVELDSAGVEYGHPGAPDA
jgi:hypothetical protein